MSDAVPGGGKVIAVEEGDVVNVTRPLPRRAVLGGKVVAGILAILAGALAVVPFFPVWVAFAVSALAAILAFLSGQASPGLKVPSSPLVPVGLVPVFLAAATATASAASFFDGWLSGALLLASSILAAVAGKVSPQVGGMEVRKNG